MGSMPVSEETYERLALEDIEGQWEFVCGRPRQKPGMTMQHNSVANRLAMMIARQLDEDRYELRTNMTRVVLPNGDRYIPDVLVLTREVMQPLRGSPELEAYLPPLPFVAEVWSPSTGDYDVEAKFPGYRERGDLEIWRVHPYEKTVVAWRRQPDGSYAESRYASGIVPIESLPGVVVDLARLFR